VDRLLYRFLIIPVTCKALLEQGQQFAWMNRPDWTDWGPGRTDPMNLTKYFDALTVCAVIAQEDVVPRASHTTALCLRLRPRLQQGPVKIQRNEWADGPSCWAAARPRTHRPRREMPGGRHRIASKPALGRNR
jgi:hypothetical protein